MVAGDKIFVAKVHELGGAVAEAFLVPAYPVLHYAFLYCINLAMQDKVEHLAGPPRRPCNAIIYSMTGRCRGGPLSLADAPLSLADA